MHSGSIRCSWAMNQSLPERGFKLASLLGKDSCDPEEVVKFLRTVPAEDIVKAQASVLTREETLSHNLAFGINNDEVAENPVLPEPIEQLLKKDADVPVIISYTSHEFIMFMKDISEKSLSIYNEYLPTHVKTLGTLKKLGDEEIKNLFNVVKDRYFEGKPIDKEKLYGLSNFMTDTFFGIPAILMLEDRVKRLTAPNYFCKFSYIGNEKTSTDLLVTRHISGASHVDDIAYLLYLPKCKTENPDPPAVGTKDRITLERMTRMWTNFAKTGQPTSIQDEFVNVNWKPATANDLCYLDIGNELCLLPLPSHLLSSKLS